MSELGGNLLNLVRFPRSSNIFNYSDYILYYSAGIILNTNTRRNKAFFAYGRYYEQQAAYKVHKVFPLQAFVATFKSLVVFVSKENLRFFVSLCSNI